MVNAAFVAPFLMPATVRFVATAARIPGVRLSLVTTAAAEQVPADLARDLAGHWRVDDALDPRQIADAVAGLSRQLGPDRAAGGRPGAAAGAARARPRGAGHPGHGRRDRAQRAGQVADEGGAHRGRGAVRAPPARPRAGRGARVRGGGRVPARREAARGRGGAGHLPPRRRTTRCAAGSRRSRPDRRRPACWRSSSSATSSRSTACRSAAPRCGRPSRTTGRRRSTVLRNPWIQWTVLLPRELDDPRYQEIFDVGPAAVRALGVRDGLTHMEWFRRQDGSVAVSEVGARPPGAQIATMLGYVHDVDFFRLWCELVILDRFTPPERKYAAGCAYLRGQGRGRVRAVHGVDEAAAPAGAPRGRGEAARAGPARVDELRGRGLRDRPRPGHGSRRRRARRDRERRSGSSWWNMSREWITSFPPLFPLTTRERGVTTVVMLSPGYPAEMPYFTRALADRGGARDRRRRPAAARAARRGPRRARPLRARVAGRRGRRARRPPRARRARPVRPGGVPVGAVHDPGGADHGRSSGCPA